MFSFHHICLSVTNRKRSVQFYSHLGFEQLRTWEAGDKSFDITHLKNDIVILELFCFKQYYDAPSTSHSPKTDLPFVGTKHFGLKVDSIETAREDLITKGIIGKDTVITSGISGSRYFFIQDPDGILVEITENQPKI